MAEPGAAAGDGRIPAGTAPGGHSDRSGGAEAAEPVGRASAPPTGRQGSAGGVANDTIFQSIAAHMEAPPESLAEVKRLHKEAVRQRRISNVPGDLPGSQHTKQWQDQR